MTDPVMLLIQTTNPSFISSVSVPGRPERKASPPEPYASGSTGTWLSKRAGGARNVWVHQAAALSLGAAGKPASEFDLWNAAGKL